MDPLSDVLSLLQPHSQYYAGFDAAGDWAFNFPPYKKGIKFMAVTKGTCWGVVEDAEKPICFHAGDCILLNSHQSLLLSSDPALPVTDGASLAEEAVRNGLVKYNGGGDVFILSGLFIFSGEHAGVLFDALPSIVHIPKATDQAEVIRWSLAQWATELREPKPGGILMSTHLAHLMLVQVLRLFLTTSDALPQGWFRALTDKQIGQAIMAIHAESERNWTLLSLAQVAGVSRTVFAQRFKALVGRTAMEYLSRWRMLKAADRLQNSSDSVATIAFSSGYESESAFSTAFKRVMAVSPGKYRRNALDERMS
ncbi:hypothetical protein Xmau_01045 [Xenorhabdus mauleonii]|uniref:AraC-type DNA-binding protein n=1 Tax=Xenorhabdus mauleonii TaxID=351675 RepID=A0A1I3M443_9GAMM|nr:AraC family transcriptional regulator [Xenorhabdus mauleonii]PHM45395.1 hypothetical protein Xmau_01045 [Xenorhabdus mauleonii]SFI91733.1 AraC-type DNA-binding protein [Xenorhabdus mauleonii]